MIMNGLHNNHPDEVIVHKVSHQRNQSPPKVICGVNSKPGKSVPAKQVQNITGHGHGPIEVDGVKRPALQNASMAGDGPVQLRKVAKNKMGTLQVNEGVDLKALFCD
jgi:hypothetical protein